MAMTVDASGGGIAVSEALRSVNGTAVTPCLTEAARSWWVTGGSTEPGQSFLVQLFNPNESRAVAIGHARDAERTARPDRVRRSRARPAHARRTVGPQRRAERVADHGARGCDRRRRRRLRRWPRHPAPDLGVAAPWVTGSVAEPRRAVGVERPVLCPPRCSSPGPGAESVTATVQVLAPSGCTTRCPAPFTVSVPASGSTTSLTLSPTSRVPLDEQIAAVVTAPLPGRRRHRAGLDGQLGRPGAPLYDPIVRGGQPPRPRRPARRRPSPTSVCVNPTGHAVSLHLETVTRSGPHPFGASYTVAAHTDLVLGSSVLRGVVDGVLELVADGD